MKRGLWCAVLWGLILLNPVEASYPLIRLGFYYVPSELNGEQFESELKKLLNRAGNRLGATLELALVEPLPILPPVTKGMILIRDENRTIRGEGIEFASLSNKLEAAAKVVNDRQRIDFLFVVSRGRVLQEITQAAPDGSRPALYRSVGGITYIGWWAALINYHGTADEYFEYSILHELGHLVGLDHASPEDCLKTHLVMCRKYQEDEKEILMLTTEGENFVIKNEKVKRLADFQIGEEYRRKIMDFRPRK